MVNDLVRAALAASSKQLAMIRGGTVTYKSADPLASFSVFAMPTLQRTISVDFEGFVHDAVLMDWIIRADQFSSVTGFYNPRNQDSIVDGIDTWIIQHPAGEREWEWHDPYQDSYRIHCILDKARYFDEVKKKTFDDYVNAVSGAYTNANGENYGKEE